jgi:hypothetical protein
MANIKISDLPDAALPLDGPNSFFEVQTIEAGVDVSRKVASDQLTLAAAIIVEDEGVPLVGGATTLDFVGAGVVASGAGDTKTITIPGGGQVDSVVSGVNITIDATDPINPIANLDAAITGVSVNAVTLNAGGAATNYLDESGAYSVPAGAGGQVDSVVGGTNISVNVADPVNPIVNLDAAIAGVSVNAVTLDATGVATNYLDETGAYSVPPSGGVSDPLIIGSINLTSAESVATTGTPYNDVAINIGANLVGTQGMTRYGRQNIQTMPSAFGFNSNLFININGAGTNGSNTIIGGLNGAQVEVDFGVAVRFQHAQSGVVVAETAAPASGGFLANNQATGVGLERVLTTADLGGGVTNPMTSDLDGDGFNLDDMGVLFMREQAAADADVAGQGQLWVLDEGFTQTLMFTADNGNDIELAAINLTDMNTASLLVAGTTFVESLVFQPDINRDYIVTATFELQSPAADNMDVEMVIDTNAVFKGVLTYSNQSGAITGTFALESQVGDVITNIVTVPTDGSLTPDGTYCTIVGALNMGATSGTHSVRVAKNADTGADGLFVAFAALQASVLQVS